MIRESITTFDIRYQVLWHDVVVLSSKQISLLVLKYKEESSL